MTVNYTVMHCNTLHYTVEYTVTHRSSDNKTRSNKVAGMQSGYCPPEHTAAKKVLLKTNMNLLIMNLMNLLIMKL